MSKVTYLLFLTLFLIQTACSKKIDTNPQKNLILNKQQEYLIPIKVGAKYGYINQEDSIIIPAIYDLAMPFVQNRAIVIKNFQEGLINKKGEYVIAPQKMTKLYWEGNAKAKREKFKKLTSDYVIAKTHAEKYARIFDLNGNQILENQFYTLFKGAKDQFIATNDKFEEGVVDLSGEVIIPFNKDVEIRYYKKLVEKYIVIDKQKSTCPYYDVNGNLISENNPCSSALLKGEPLEFDVPQQFKDKFITHRRILENGYRKFSIANNNSNSYILNNEGEIICEQCDRILACGKYYIKHIIDDPSGSRQNKNIVDFEGKALFSENYYQINALNGDAQHCPTRYILCKLEKEETCFISDQHGHALSDSYNWIQDFAPGFNIASDKENQQVILNNDGQIINTVNSIHESISNDDKRGIKKVGNLVASVRKSSDPYADIVYLNPQAIPQYHPFAKRKSKDFQSGDYVLVKESNEIRKITGFHESKPMINYFNPVTYEEQFKVYDPDELSILFIDFKKNKYLKIYSYEEEKFILKLKKLDQVHLKRDKGDVEGYMREINLDRLEVQPEIGVGRYCEFKDILNRITWLSARN